MRPTTAVDHATATRASVAANRMRAEYLQSVAAGMLTVNDVVTAACEDGHRPLLRISLDQLLRARPGWGQARSHAALTRIVTFCGQHPTKDTLRRLDLAWLLDPRAAGARLLAFLDALSPESPANPLAGFPYGVRPTRPAGGGQR